MKKQREFNCTGKMTLHFRGVERGKDLNVSNSSEVIDMMEQYFSEILSTDSEFLIIDKLQIDQFSYDIRDIE